MRNEYFYNTLEFKIRYEGFKIKWWRIAFGGTKGGPLWQ
jgi:hypothetical protein